MLDRMIQNQGWLERNVQRGQTWTGRTAVAVPFIADAKTTLDPVLVDQMFGTEGRIISAPILPNRRVYLFQKKEQRENFISMFSAPYGARRLLSIKAAKRLP